MNMLRRVGVVVLVVTLAGCSLLKGKPGDSLVCACAPDPTGNERCWSGVPVPGSVEAVKSLAVSWLNALIQRYGAKAGVDFVAGIRFLECGTVQAATNAGAFLELAEDETEPAPEPEPTPEPEAPSRG